MALSIILAFVACSGESPTDKVVPGAFSLSYAGPGINANASRAGTSTITIVRSGSFDGPVTLSISGEAAGISSVLTPTVIPRGQSTAILTLSVTDAALPDTYSISLVARPETAGVTEQTLSIPVIITPPPGVTVSLSTSLLGHRQTARAAAVVLADSGRIVRDADITWSSSNLAVATVTNQGLVTAGQHGSANITASTSRGVGSLEIKVAPLFHGKVYTADGGSTLGLRMFVEHSTTEIDSADVRSDGSFAVGLRRVGNGATAAIYFDSALRPKRLYVPSLRSGVVLDTTAALEMVAIPLQWTIVGGLYGGKVAPIDIGEAFGPREHKLTPYLRGNQNFGYLLPGEAKFRTLVAWPEAAYPIPIVLVRENLYRPLLPISADDSVRLWREIDDLEQVIGQDLFQPMRYDQVTRFQREGSELRPVGVIGIALTKESDSSAFFGIADGDTCPKHFLWCDANVGTVRIGRFRDASDMKRILQHELLHTLSMGHTCVIPSIMSYAGSSSCPQGSTGGSRELTTSDVAYWQLIRSVNKIVRSKAIGWSFYEAVNGERRFILNTGPF